LPFVVGEMAAMPSPPDAPATVTDPIIDDGVTFPTATSSYE